MDFSWNFGSINKIFLETILQPEVWNMKYVDLRRLQFLIITLELLTKFHMEKVFPSIFLTSWQCYIIKIYTRDTLFQVKLIGNFISLITWLCPKTVSGCKLNIRHVAKVRCHLSSPLIKGYHWSYFPLHTICRSWVSRVVGCIPPFPLY